MISAREFVDLIRTKLKPGDIAACEHAAAQAVQSIPPYARVIHSGPRRGSTELTFSDRIAGA